MTSSLPAAMPPPVKQTPAAGRTRQDGAVCLDGVDALHGCLKADAAVLGWVVARRRHIHKRDAPLARIPPLQHLHFSHAQRAVACGGEGWARKGNGGGGTRRAHWALSAAPRSGGGIREAHRHTAS